MDIRNVSASHTEKLRGSCSVLLLAIAPRSTPASRADPGSYSRNTYKKKERSRRITHFSWQGLVDVFQESTEQIFSAETHWQNKLAFR